ncbi:MAG: DNA replication protein DnaD [Chloroflexi bacterium]|jgi:DnaD/phage-associated family protein|nr:MAG: DNA replication protein DnaD [Chloroflexota bacterium]
MKDLGELKTVLRVFYLIHRKKGSPRLVTQAEIDTDPVLRRSFSGHSSVEGDIGKALDAAVYSGVLLRTRVGHGASLQTAYVVNSESERHALAGLDRARVDAPAALADEAAEEPPISDIFTLYQEHVGLLTPLIVDELKDAEQRYPPAWVRSAFLEAVERNKRSWRYIARILERWREEGRGNGEPGRHSAKSDPKAYLRGWRRSSDD